LIKDKVTIVIPVYNAEKFLAQSIDSILNQTYRNIEILVIDDGSTDNSLKILQNHSDKITIISQPNQGIAIALNTAIKKINGEWFKYFSADDVLYPNAIEILIQEAKKLPENTIVYSNWEIIDEKDKKLGNFLESNYNNLGNFEFNVRLLDNQQINVNTTLIPSSLFEKGCLFKNHEDPVAPDYDFLLRAGILYNIHFHLLEKSLVKYRVHSNQISHMNIARTLDYLSKVRNQVLSQLDESKRNQYFVALKEYNRNKPISKKTLERILRFSTSVLPNWATDRLITLYLNKIRRNR